jgi:hypothetical protein
MRILGGCAMWTITWSRHSGKVALSRKTNDRLALLSQLNAQVNQYFRQEYIMALFIDFFPKILWCIIWPNYFNTLYFWLNFFKTQSGTWLGVIRKPHECVFWVEISHKWFCWPGNPRDRRSSGFPRPRKPRSCVKLDMSNLRKRI